MEGAAVRLVVSDDLERSRLTVFFRAILAIPHLFWLGIWGSVTFVLVIVNWFATLFTGQPPAGLHDVIGRYLRYAIHVYGYLFLAANPYPGFLGDPGSYPVDLWIAPPERQNRWITGFRAILSFPAAVVAGSLFSSGGAARNNYNVSFGVAFAAAFLGWFAILVRRAMPRGLRDAVLYALGYVAQLDAYLFLLTDRYPNADPLAILGPYPTDHPVRLEVSDDLSRNRLTVFFRLVMAIPHLLWLLLWGIAALLVAIVNWFATLFTGVPPAALQRFLVAYLRYATHVTAFVSLVADPFPGFTGRAGSYPVDLDFPPPERQNRWVTGFRALLAIPAWLMASTYGGLLSAVAFLTWFAALFTGRAPRGLRNAGAVSIRYSQQTYAYLYLVTERYPYAGPTDPALAEPPSDPIVPV